MIYYLTIDGSDFVPYARLSTAKNAGQKRARQHAHVVKKKVMPDGSEVIETVWAYDVPKEVGA